MLYVFSPVLGCRAPPEKGKFAKRTRPPRRTFFHLYYFIFVRALTMAEWSILDGVDFSYAECLSACLLLLRYVCRDKARPQAPWQLAYRNRRWTRRQYRLTPALVGPIWHCCRQSLPATSRIHYIYVNRSFRERRKEREREEKLFNILIDSHGKHTISKCLFRGMCTACNSSTNNTNPVD